MECWENVFEGSSAKVSKWAMCSQWHSQCHWTLLKLSSWGCCGMASFAAEGLEVLEMADMQSIQNHMGIGSVGMGIDGKSMAPHWQWGFVSVPWLQSMMWMGASWWMTCHQLRELQSYAFAWQQEDKSNRLDYHSYISFKVIFQFILAIATTCLQSITCHVLPTLQVMFIQSYF